ncbi:ABC transporter substrate-binding protein [Agromyces atrinae]|uniref:ABC transporter substrate-binding protein n=1 Tax=Agromyces atrinae TaxID=592376 RepID=UPI001F56F0CA|nr:ABC transporter substrate-binding protein [Agromyces atrinae]MCI2956432.1 ABC transporter substrate-binding protein [Agromyces atrinae]
MTTAPTRLAFAAVAAVAAIGLAGCSTPGDASPESAGAYPLTIDNCGTELTIESEPETILTIGTSAVSLLDAAGASDRIIARSGEFGAELPDGLENPPTDAEIVDPSDPTTEKIVGAGADIVVGYGLFNSTDDDLAAAGITNIVIDGECSHDAALSDPTDFDAIFADVERLATVFGTTDAADARLTELRAELTELESSVPADAERETAAVVYYFSSSSTLSARGGQGIANDILDRAGFDNVYGDEPSVYLEANIETLLAADPDTIVIAYGLYGETFDEAKAHFLSEPGAAELSAVVNDRVVGVLGGDLSPDPDAVRGFRAVLEATGRISE